MKIIYSILSLFVGIATLAAQSKDNYMKAMKSELTRNMSELRMEAMPAPFIIAYSIADGTNIVVEGKYNAIFNAKISRMVIPGTTVVTGDYATTNSKSWTTMTSPQEQLFPLDYNYDEMRRIFWECSDMAYKNSAQQLLERRRYMKQQQLDKDKVSVPDTYKLSPIKREFKSEHNNSDLKKCKEYVSALLYELEKHKQIKDYNVKLTGSSGTIYKCTSEEVEFSYPISQYSVSISINCLDSSRVIYSNRLDLNATSLEKMPSIEQAARKIEQLYNLTVASSRAKKLDDSYFGPILLQEVGVYHFFEEWLSNDFINFKGSIYDQNQKLSEGKIGKRITAAGINAVNYSSLKTYNGENLWGAFAIDADGVIPSDSVLLLQNGVLSGLLNDRFCSSKILRSNGYNRMTMDGLNGSRLSPSILKIYPTAGHSNETMVSMLIDAAKKEGLEYAYRVVRFLQNKSVATEIYRVSVVDGREELIAPSTVNFNKSSLRRIGAMSKDSNVYNVNVNGMPVTYIVPNSLLIDEVEIDKYTGNKDFKSLL